MELSRVGSATVTVRPADRSGFALAAVILLLFAVAIASVTGYAVVSLEADMAIQEEERAEAARVARAGLERYFGEHLGLPDDTVTYAIGTGDAIITARQVAVVDSADGIDLYLVRAEGQVSRLAGVTSPARVVVYQYARLNSEPIARTGAMIASYANINLLGLITIRGIDSSTAGACPIDGEDTNGVVHRGGLVTTCVFGNCLTIDGSPSTDIDLGSHSAIYDTAGIRWDILTDPSFPVDYSVSSAGDMPNFGTIPANEYPVIRAAGNVTLTGAWTGRGVLIIPGTATFGCCGFTWDGIVLSGSLGNSFGFGLNWTINGMLIGGMNGGGGSVTWLTLLGVGPTLQYNACNALAASNALAYFDPLPGTFWEGR